MPEPAAAANPFTLCFGARDWEHQGWLAAYYPDDLPRDWRLAYYANDLLQVLVPQARWLSVGADAWDEWVDAVTPGFRFFLELETGPVPNQLVACVRALGGRCGGVVAAPSAGPVDLGCPRYARRTRLTPAEALRPVALVLEPDDLGDLRRQRALFEGLAQQFETQGELPLFLAGPAPSMETLLNAQQLAELLGLA